MLLYKTIGELRCGKRVCLNNRGGGFLKKNIIFVSTALWVGGIESALVNLLNSIDYDRYNVTCLILRNCTDLAPRVPKNCELIIADRNTAVSFKEPYKYARLFGLIEKPQTESRFRLFIWRLMCFFLKAPEARLYSKYVKNNLADRAFDTAVIYSDVVAEYAVRGVNAKKYIMFYHHGAARRVYHDTVGYKKCDKIVTVSPSQGEMLLEFIPKYKDKITVINNIVDVDDIIKKSKEKILLPYSSEYFNIASCGRLSVEKGMDLAINACKLLTQRGFSNIKWRIIGGGPETEALKASVKKLRLENTICFTGMLNNPYPDIADADLYVQPSRFEGHCVAIMEAKILGKPIVATKNAAKEQIEDGVNGILCEATAESLAEAVAKALGNRKLLGRITEESEKTDLEKQNEAALKKLYNIL